MYSVKIVHFNDVFVKILTEKSIERELYDHFSFMADGFKFHPKFRAKIWDGRIHLYSLRNKTIYRGLVSEIIQFCEERGYDVDYLGENIDEKITIEDLENFFQEFKLKVTPRDYQKQAIFDSIKYGRRVILSPTASGKSLIIYSILRILGVKTLLIVPRINLVTQMYTDFQDYSVDDDEWDVEEKCSKIMAGAAKENLNEIVISTWQSIHNLKKDWYDRQEFGLVIVDEVHGAKANSLKKVMENLSNTKYRIGLTGTLDDIQVHEWTIKGLFGDVSSVVETHELIKKGTIAKLKIDCLFLKYKKETCAHVCALGDYHKEMEFITAHERRNKLIVNLALSTKGNTLVLYNYVDKHGKILQELFDKYCKGKLVFFIHGKIKDEEREEIRQKVEKSENGCIILASYGTYSTGVNIVNLHNIILAHPIKGKIRLLQSIGRGLRKNENKESCNLYDIADDFRYKKKKNYTYFFMIERLRIYVKARFPYKIREIGIE